MKKFRTTSPSRYYERQTHAKDDVKLEYPASADFESIAAILGAAVFGFTLGMIAVASVVSGL